MHSGGCVCARRDDKWNFAMRVKDGAEGLAGCMKYIAYGINLLGHTVCACV